MACCIPFTSCFTGWFTKSSSNVVRPQYSVSPAATARNRNKLRQCACGGHHGGRFAEPVTVPTKTGRLKKILRDKRSRKEEEKAPLPEPCTVSQLPAGVLKHWAPQSRCCEEVMEEIRLSSMGGDSDASPVEPGANDNEKRDMLARFRSLFVKQKTPEELEMEALRKERKAVIKYLKWVGLYDQRMSYEHMKKLKTVTEDALESERQKVEIEMKELERPKDASVLESGPENVPGTEQPTVPKIEPVAVSEEKSEQFVVPRPEGPLEETDGTVIHPGTGLPVSAPIDLPSDVPCIQCNPEAIVVQAEIHPEPKTDEAMEPMNEDKGVEQPVAEMANEVRPPPLPAKIKPRVVGFVLKPGVTLEDLDAIEVDPHYNPSEVGEEQDRANPMKPFKDYFTPKPLQNLRWTFGHP
ncbi:uncharacterized protein LOC110674207 isoform X2 [Aedes aegypti]|uniref:Uncharacterized protein n=1 Tax=Aedes aegypti TaxID=7159 RepID=A0A6I8U9S6_AEDAE|nr:uncharacterized protein LOC110674207 isoform X2 [Aedes aegypti]